MKNSIATLLNSYVSDSSEYIKANGGNAAEYILEDTEACDNGWLWFLSDEEIEEFEKDSNRASELIAEIIEYVNANYNYDVE
jgi:hypothetical protein